MRHALILALLLLSMVPADVTAQADTPRLIDQLGGEDSKARYAAYRRLLTRKTPETLAGLTKALPTFNATAQSLGLGIVTAFPDPGRESALREFIKGKPSFVCLASAVWFRQRGDRKMVRHIVRCLREPGPSPALNLMLVRLWNVKDPAVIQAVQAHVSKTTDHQELTSALRMLARAKARTVMPKIREILAVEGLDADRRGLCAAFLVVMGETRQSRVLAEALPEMKSWYRLSFLLQEAPHLEDVVLAAILACAEQERGASVRYAIELLAKHSYGPAVSKLKEWLDSGDRERSKAALSGLMTMGEELPARKLMALLDSDDEGLCITAADTLRRMDDHSGLPRLIELIRQNSPSKSRALMTMARFRDRRVVPVLIKLLDDEEATVRRQAFSALSAVIRSLFPYRSFDFALWGYDYSGEVAGRRAAIARTQQWWETHAKPKQ